MTHSHTDPADPGFDLADEKPEADVSEQASPADPATQDPVTEPSPDAEAPEADALEQQAPVRPGGDDRLELAGAEAAEADLLDQAREAAPDDDEPR